MLFKSLIVISILAASANAADDKFVCKKPLPIVSDVSQIVIPGNAVNFPGKIDNLDALYPGEIFPRVFPDPSKLEAWPEQPEGSNRDECSLDIKVSVGSCKSGAFGYRPRIIGYNDPSQSFIDGKVKFVVEHENNNYTDFTEVTVDCYWRGRIFVTDTPEIRDRMGLASVRVDTSPTGMQAWVTADPDRETGYKQNQIANIGFFEFGGHQPYNKNWSTARGYDESRKVSSQKKEKLYIQFC